MTKLQALTEAIVIRKRLKHHGKGRNDWHNVETAIRIVETFLGQYPFASDDRIRDWAHRREAEVRILVPANRDDLYNTIMA